MIEVRVKVIVVEKYRRFYSIIRMDNCKIEIETIYIMT